MYGLGVSRAVSQSSVLSLKGNGNSFSLREVRLMMSAFCVSAIRS